MRTLQFKAEQLKINGMRKRFELVATPARPCRAFIDVEEARLIHFSRLHVRRGKRKHGYALGTLGFPSSSFVDRRLDSVVDICPQHASINKFLGLYVLSCIVKSKLTNGRAQMKQRNLLQSFSQSRREFLRTSCGIAGGIAAASIMPRTAWAARENEMNLYCWEGYNSDKVLDPFRKEFNTNVRAQGLISDPDAVNQLRAGDTKIWDVININNSWARTQLYPNNLIVPLDQARFRPLWDMMMPEFKWPYHWAMDQSGEHLLGMVQRVGVSGIAVNTDKISIETATNDGYQMFLSDDFKGKYGILMYDDWVIMLTCMASGFSPFTNLDEQQIAVFEKNLRKLINNAAILSDDLNAINLGLINGSIIAQFHGSVYSVSSARLDGNRNIRAIIPRGGPDGKSGVAWMELTSLVNNPELSPRGADFLEYCFRPEVCKNVAFAEGTYNPVAQMGDERVRSLFSKEELDAIQFDTFAEDVSRCADFDVIPDYAKLHDIYTAAVREREG